MEFQGLIDCILVLKSTLLSVAENGDKLGVETFSIAIVTAALTDGSEMSLIKYEFTCYLAHITLWNLVLKMSDSLEDLFVQVLKSEQKAQERKNVLLEGKITRRGLGRPTFFV